MGVDSLALGNFARPHRIDLDGRVYEIRLIDQSAKAEWERRLYERTVEKTETLAQYKPAGWKEDTLLQLENEFLAGRFAFFTEQSLKLLETPAGMELLLTILTGCDLSALAALLIAKPTEVKAKLHLVIKESFPGIKIVEKEGHAVPN